MAKATKMTEPPPWVDHRLAAAPDRYALCHNTKRHRYPDDEYTDEEDKLDAFGELLIVKRSQTCTRCGTKAFVKINVQIWRLVSSTRYEWPDDYRFEGPRPTPEATLFDHFRRTSKLVDKVTTLTAPAPPPRNSGRRRAARPLKSLTGRPLKALTAGAGRRR